MPNPLAQAVESGIKANEMVGDLFVGIGNNENPNGIVTSAYRNARRSMASALQERNRLAAAGDVLLQLRETVTRDMRTFFAEAQELGAGESARQMRFYKIASPDVSRVSLQLSTQNQSALSVVTSTIDRQIAAINAMILTGSADEEIIGDEERVGVLRQSEVISAAAFWATALLWDAFDYWTTNHSNGTQFYKQAVAALDNRTTDCCLRVHAQVQPMSAPFILTGTPRFADKVDWPAFHWYCRTSGVLYLPRFDDGITTQMRAGADFFLAERAAGRNPDNDPANAF